MEFTIDRDTATTLENWALFEPFKLTPGPNLSIERTDPDLVRALAIHSLRFA
jgi:hypothetical protein